MINVMFVLDETGSMSVMELETVNAFNKYVKELKKSKKKIEFSLLRFDSTKTDLYYDKVDIRKVKKLIDYKPGACTPLYDAIGKAINSIDNDKCIVVILTDGEENASREFTYKGIKQLIEDKKKLGWEFLFLATGLNETQVQTVYYVGRSLNLNTKSSTTVSGLMNTATYETQCYIDNN